MQLNVKKEMRQLERKISEKVNQEIIKQQIKADICNLRGQNISNIKIFNK